MWSKPLSKCILVSKNSGQEVSLDTSDGLGLSSNYNRNAVQVFLSMQLPEHKCSKNVEGEICRLEYIMKVNATKKWCSK